MSRAGDEETLRRLAEGDREALAELYDVHGATCYRVALLLTRDAGAAEDAVLAAFLDAWRERPSAVGRTPRGWLLTLLRRRLALTPGQMPTPPRPRA